MKRKTFKLFLFLCILTSICFITSCKKNKPVDETFPEIVNKLTSYKLVGTLESNFPSGTKECNVTTYYQSPNMYRVELQNPNTVETQIMIKNADGVYVLVPSINKTFKVNSSWPANSSYPYLLQSISNDIISDNNMITKKEGKDTTLELKAKLFNGDQNTTQKIIFDENKMPKEVLLYDKNHNLLTRFVIKSIEQNPSLDQQLFKTTESLETLNVYYKENPIEYERLVTYPTYYPEGTSLKEEVITGDTMNKFAIMKFGGTTNYTIIQKFMNDSEDQVVEYVNGDVYVMGGSFAFINENNICFYTDGIQYTIASNEVEVIEMIKMGESLKTTDIK